MCDGHGVAGHTVSAYVKNNLPRTLENCKNFGDAFLQLDRKMNQTLDCGLSGTTVCCVLMEGLNLRTFNVGDSRAIKVALIEEDPKHWRISPLAVTEDHKPELPEE